MNENEEDL